MIKQLKEIEIMTEASQEKSNTNNNLEEQLEEKLKLIENLIESDLANGKCLYNKLMDKLFKLGKSPKKIIRNIESIKRTAE